QMQSLNTFSGAGWSIGSAPSNFTWNIIQGSTYPFLSSLMSAVTIQTPLANEFVDLAAAGNVIAFGTTGANHSFVAVVPFNQTILTFDPNSSFTGSTGNTIFSVTPLSFDTKNLINNELLLDNPSLTLSNTLLASTLGSLEFNLDYFANGTNLTINPNINFLDNAGTSYLLDGNITTSGTGSLIFNVPLIIGASNPSLNGSNIAINNTISGSNPLNIVGNGSTNTFTLNAGNAQNWFITGSNSGDVTGLPNFTSN